MSDPQTTDKYKPHPLIVTQHKAQIDLIEFTKKRQFSITNYSVLIYVGIFGVAHSWLNIRTGERVALTLLTILTLVCAIWFLIQIQADAGNYRRRLEIINNYFLSPHEREIAGIVPYENPALRGVWFLVALIGVVTIGAGLVIYSLLRAH